MLADIFNMSILHPQILVTLLFFWLQHIHLLEYAIVGLARFAFLT